jgi:hypothetical protein
MWEPQRLTTLWAAPRPVTGVALPFFFIFTTIIATVVTAITNIHEVIAAVASLSNLINYFSHVVFVPRHNLCSSPIEINSH